MPEVSLDLPSAIILAVVLAAVVLVFWASRPSVIARYSVKNHPSEPTPQDPPSAPAAPSASSAPGDAKRPV